MPCLLLYLVCISLCIYAQPKGTLRVYDSQNAEVEFELWDTITQTATSSVYLVKPKSADSKLTDTWLALKSTNTLKADSLVFWDAVWSAKTHVLISEQCPPHPHLLKYMGPYKNRLGTRMYIASEYCSLGDLKDYLDNPTSRAFTKPAECLFREAVLGVRHLHRHYIAHRDLKPENMFIHKNATLEIGDFGFALWVSRTEMALHQGKISHEFTGRIGTMAFAAPELIDAWLVYKSKSASPFVIQYDPFKADVWSLGIVFYLLKVVNTLPWSSANRQEDPLFKQYIGSTTMDTTLWSLYLQQDELDLINKMLAVDPDTRISSLDLIQHPIMKRYEQECRQY